MLSGVYDPKILGNDKKIRWPMQSLKGVYNPKNLGNDKLSS